MKACVDVDAATQMMTSGSPLLQRLQWFPAGTVILCFHKQQRIAPIAEQEE